MDVEGEEWIYLEDRDRWGDMADFAASLADESVRADLERAIQGRGAFSRFRSAVRAHDVAALWYDVRADRRWGRARQMLADRRIRAV